MSYSKSRLVNYINKFIFTKDKLKIKWLIKFVNRIEVLRGEKRKERYRKRFGNQKSLKI